MFLGLGQHEGGLFIFFRMRTLMLNTFDLPEDNITINNVLEWMEKLNSTYPSQFAEIAGLVEKCDLESELDTVCSSSSLSSISVHSKTYLKLKDTRMQLFFPFNRDNA